MNKPIRDKDLRPMAEKRTAPKYVHLKVHSAYSLLEGALQIGRIAKLAVANGMPAVGLTDTNNMFGALEFSEKLAEAGLQPIVGCTLQTDMRETGGAPTAYARPGANEPPTKLAGAVAAFARTELGYANLMKLASACHLKPADTEPPHVKIDDLADLSGDLIVLTGGPDGPVDAAIRAGQPELARKRLERLHGIFNGALFVEIQRHGLEHEAATEPQLLELAYDLGIPIVATNECYFATPDDHEAHDALICIADGAYVTEEKRRRYTREHYFKSPEEMAALFADLPEALASTIEIAKRCTFRPTGRKPILPRFVAAPPGASEEDRLELEAAELRREAEAGLKARLATEPLAPGFTAADYAKRLAYEVDVIAQMKFPGYFLIVADFIKWAKANGIPVGPGRGSGAGSVVAWSLTITDLDPLRFGLLFERFLNPERISMPDFDIDFCQDRRDEVIRYVQGKYGADRVAQIITHGKLQARAVLRDVGRVLQMPYGQVDRLCKLVPNNPANPVTLAQAIEIEPKLQEARDSEPVVARLLEIAQKLEGLYRHASTHAAGMVIGDRPLDELVPLYRDPKSSFPITQFNWKLVEEAGLVKFDFLGLKTLTVLKKAVDLIRRGRGIEVDLLKLPLDDRKTYELLARADTVGVFQLEGTGVRDCLKRLKPDRFEDIMAMTALYRPGPMDNIPTYINRKHGEEPVDYLHPMLEPILKETHGVIIYQEQVLQIAQVMAGYSLGQADILRKAMGKKDKAIMAKQQAEFVAGAVKKGVARDEAAYIFELVDKFAGYGFNKAHTAAYAHVAYYTAYLKANFREEFLAASMTLDMGNTEKLSMYTAEAKKSGIAILPPCINASEVDFLAEPLPRAGRQARRHPLLARRAQEHRRASGGEHRDRAHGPRAVQGPGRRRRPAQHESAQQAGAGDPCRRRRLRCARGKPRAGDRQRGVAPGVRKPPGRERGPGHQRPLRRRRGGAAAARPAADQGVAADGAAAARVRGRGLLPLGPPARCLRHDPAQARDRQLHRARRAGRARRGGGTAGGHRRLHPRAPLAEGQQVRLRALLRAHRSVRGGDLLRDARRIARAAGARHGRGGHGRGRARRRYPETAGANHPVAGRGRQQRAARPESRARPARHRGRQGPARGAQGAPAQRREGHAVPLSAARRPGARGGDRHARPLRHLAGAEGRDRHAAGCARGGRYLTAAGAKRSDPAHPPPCQTRIASTGWISMMMLSVRLSRMNTSMMTSVAISRATITHAGSRDASRKPTTIAAMSPTELMMLSP